MLYNVGSMSPPVYPLAQLRPRRAGFCFTWQIEIVAEQEDSACSQWQGEAMRNLGMQDRELYRRTLGIEAPGAQARLVQAIVPVGLLPAGKASDAVAPQLHPDAKSAKAVIH